MGADEPLGPEDYYGRLLMSAPLIRLEMGDQGSVCETIISEYDRSIYGFILSIVKNSQDAEEIMQETHIKVWTPLRVKVPGEAAGMDKPLRPGICQKFRTVATSPISHLSDLEGEETGEVWRLKQRRISWFYAAPATRS